MMVITMASYALQMPPRVAHAKPPGPTFENNSRIKLEADKINPDTEGDETNLDTEDDNTNLETPNLTKSPLSLSSLATVDK